MSAKEGSRISSPASPDDVLLPPGTRLLHIGPPKTGTSTLQAAFHARRAETLAEGVRYAGSARHSGAAVLAVLGRHSFHRDTGSPPIGKWQDLAGEVRRARESRVLVSSEFFADAGSAAIPRILADLGGGKVHVVVTLRPLSRLIGSQWQQYIQGYMVTSFEDWLEGVFHGPPGKMTPSFWHRHRHDQLIDRWATHVGIENMTAVVIDERDHEQVLRVFERLVGLTSGTLRADGDSSNRGMTLPEIEAVRAFNVQYREAGLGHGLYHRVMHFSAVPYVKQRTAPADEARVEAPRWAQEMAGELARTMVDRIAASGIRVVGDLEALAPAQVVADAPDPVRSDDITVPPEIAGLLAAGVVVAAGRARGHPTVNDVARAGGAGDRDVVANAAGPGLATRLPRFHAYQLAGVIVRRPASGLIRRAEHGFAAARRRGFAGDTAPLRPLTPEEQAATTALERVLAAGGLSDATGRRFGKEAAARWFGRRQAAGDRERAPNAGISPATAGGLAMAALIETGLVREVSAGRAEAGPAKAGIDRAPRLRPVRFAWAEPPELAVVPSRELAAIALARLVAAAARRVRGVDRRAGSATQR